MKLNNNNSKKGFIEVIVIIILGLVFLNFIGFDIVAFLSKDGVKEFITFVKSSIILVIRDLIEIINIVRGA